MGGRPFGKSSKLNSRNLLLNENKANDNSWTFRANGRAVESKEACKASASEFLRIASNLVYNVCSEGRDSHP